MIILYDNTVWYSNQSMVNFIGANSVFEVMAKSSNIIVCAYRINVYIICYKTVPSSSNLKCNMIGMSQFILLKGLHFVTVINANTSFSLENSKQALERYWSTM